LTEEIIEFINKEISSLAMVVNRAGDIDVISIRVMFIVISRRVLFIHASLRFAPAE